MTIFDPINEPIDTTEPPIVIGYDEDSIAASGRELVRVALLLSRPMTDLEAQFFSADRATYAPGEDRVTVNHVELGHLDHAVERVGVATYVAHRDAAEKVREDAQTVKFAKQLFAEHQFPGAN